MVHEVHALCQACLPNLAAESPALSVGFFQHCALWVGDQCAAQKPSQDKIIGHSSSLTGVLLRPDDRVGLSP